jgi:quercetin dioxygenase-like cupin family protein
MDTELEEWAALDAVGALDPETRVRFMDRLATASRAERAAVTAIYEAAARLAVGGLQPETPSADFKQRLMGQLEGTRQFATIRKDEGQWEDCGIPGIRIKLLSLDVERHTAVLLVRAEPGAVYPPHAHSGPEACYVIAGEVVVQGQSLHAGDFHHAASGTSHDALTSRHGGEFLLVVDAADYLSH